jgi:hypothetical protein
MGTAAGLLAEARKSLGLRGRPNYITRSYAGRHGNGFLTAPWCDMSVTYWARQSGTAAAVLPGGDRAYTVWHAQDFQRIGRWKSGTTVNIKQYARPGDIVFFDWGASDRINAIDHVGVIEKVLSDGRLQTIEGNTSDACLRRIRSASVIAGFGRPGYTSSRPTPPPQEEDMALSAEDKKWLTDTIAKTVHQVVYEDDVLPNAGSNPADPFDPTNNPGLDPAKNPTIKGESAVKQTLQGLIVIDGKLDRLTATGGAVMDVDALAAKLAPLVAPLVADELANRLEN